MHMQRSQPGKTQAVTHINRIHTCVKTRAEALKYVEGQKSLGSERQRQTGIATTTTEMTYVSGCEVTSLTRNTKTMFNNPE